MVNFNFLVPLLYYNIGTLVYYTKTTINVFIWKINGQ